MHNRLPDNKIKAYITAAAVERESLFDARHETAFRLFNGYIEGCPSLNIDIYATTAVLYNNAEPPEGGDALARLAQDVIHERLPWVRAIVLKQRNGLTDLARQGELIYGAKADHWIREHGVRYAIDLCMNQDASFYLDTRNLRQWLLEQMASKRVLNTFAYTSSLGVAAQASGAACVVHTDLNKRFLNVAKTSYTLNGFPINKKNFQVGDFWPHMNRLKRTGERFDCVILDPPFFSTTAHGTVDLARNAARLINKVRPLVHDGGIIIAINNALYLSGQAYMTALETLGVDGYVQVERLIPVPADCTGYPTTRVAPSLTDPAPFNHSTKIALLRIRHSSSY